MNGSNNPSLSAPRVAHVVVSLAHGGLERLVVDWTNARNRRWPGSTTIVCLDEPGDLASQVEGDPVMCLHADRSRSPWDREAVAWLRAWMRGGERWEVGGGRSEDGRQTTDSKLQTTDSGLQTTDGRGQRTEARGQRAEGAQGKAQRECAFSLNPEPSHLPPSTSHLRPPVLLHAHNLAAWQYAVLAAWGTGVRTVYTQHGVNTHNQRIRDRLRARLLALLTDELVTVSAATASSMSRSLWIPKSGIRVVVNGVAGGGGGGGGGGEGGGGGGQRTEGGGQRAEGRGQRGKSWVIGSVGRLAFVKGYDRLIRAVAGMGETMIGGRWPADREYGEYEQKDAENAKGRAQPKAAAPGMNNAVTSAASSPHCALRSSRPSVQAKWVHEQGPALEPNSPLLTANGLLSAVSLLLVGDGPERGALEELARSLGIADRVRFAGFQADPQPLLKAMDLFVLSSRSEGLSMGLLEAMAAGVPVAVTDVGANREVIENGACGILLPEDEALWPGVLGAALADRGRLQSMAERARGRVEAHYSLQATLDGYENLYCRLAGTGRRHGCGDDCACGKK